MKDYQFNADYKGVKMCHSDLEYLKKLKSLSRYFLKLLDASYNDFLASSSVFTHPLPSENQYSQLKQRLTNVSLADDPDEDIDNVLNAVGEVLGRDIVEAVANNISSLTTSKSAENFQMDIRRKSERIQDQL